LIVSLLQNYLPVKISDTIPSVNPGDQEDLGKTGFSGRKSDHLS
jgi:hypothetical protein